MSESPPWRRLLHRWFVEYNPLYLVSAALVLGGVTVLSRDLVARGFLLGQLGIPAIAELYAWGMIAGAALLTRIGLRRPAVMLALLAAFYQCDLTLHTETCAYLGWIGALAAVAWLASFVAKLYALCAAVRIRPSRSAIALPSVAAAGMILMPRALRLVETSTAAMLVGGWIFGLFAAALWTSRRVESLDALDGWGTTVLRRSVRATWIMWAVLLSAHTLFWCADLGIPVAVLVPVALLLATRFVRSEALVWILVTTALVLVRHGMPELLSFSACLSAITLALRALRTPFRHETRIPPARAPYRTSQSSDEPRIRVVTAFRPAERPAMLRLLAGAVFATYVSIWTFGWSGGALPAHAWALDATLALAVVLSCWKMRIRAPLFGLAAVAVHHAVGAGVLGAPKTTVHWGALSVGAGFVLLLASLAVSYRLHRAGEG